METKTLLSVLIGLMLVVTGLQTIQLVSMSGILSTTGMAVKADTAPASPQPTGDSGNVELPGMVGGC